MLRTVLILEKSIKHALLSLFLSSEDDVADSDNDGDDDKKMHSITSFNTLSSVFVSQYNPIEKNVLVNFMDITVKIQNLRNPNKVMFKEC